MISGKVKAEIGTDGLTYLRPQIPIGIAGISRVFQDQDATIDTGFTGWLALPEAAIEELGLRIYGERRANQASGIGVFSIYGALVSWHDRDRPVLVHQITGDPLVGMALLEGTRLKVEAREDGDVNIEELSRG